MGNAMRYNTLPITMLAAAIGWLLFSRTNGLRELVRARGRSSLSDARELAGGSGDRINATVAARDRTKHRVARKELLTGEPMAGYGA